MAYSPAQGVELCLLSTTPAPVPVTKGPLRVNRSLSIRAHPSSPYPPVFDCFGRSNWMTANVPRTAGSFIHVSGLKLRNGRAHAGGGLAVSAESVAITNVSFTNTVSDGNGEHCKWDASSLQPTCMAGGGALFIEAGRARVEYVDISQSMSTRTGGAITIFGAQHVFVNTVSLHEVRATGYGGVVVGSPGDANGTSWRLQRITGSDSKAYAGPVVALVGRGSVRDSAWSVQHVRATNTTAQHGGSISFYADQVAGSAWTIQHVATSHTSAAKGGVISVEVRNVTRNSSWSIADVAVTDSSVENGDLTTEGGGVIFLAASYAIASPWSITRVAGVNVSAAGQDGGLVHAVVHMLAVTSPVLIQHIAARNMSAEAGGVINVFAKKTLDCTWTVRRVTAADVHAHWSGGGIFLFVQNDVRNSVWNIQDVAVNFAQAGADGGLLWIWFDSMVNSTVSVKHVHASNASAKDGGVIWLVAHSAVSSSTWSIQHVTLYNTSASSRGGGLFLLASTTSNLTANISSWVSTHSRARSHGGLWSFQFLESGVGMRSAVHVKDIHATLATSGAAGGLLAALSTPPVQIPWRNLGTACADWCNCSLTPYGHKDTLPLHYPVHISCLNWSVSHSAAQAGGLASLKNLHAAFEWLAVKNVSASYGGGLWDLTGKTDVTIAHVRARDVVLASNSAAPLGAVLSQAREAGNLSMTDVNVTAGEKAAVVEPVLFSTGALVPLTVHRVLVTCPTGSIVKDGSRGSISVSEAPFFETRQGFSGSKSVCPIESEMRLIKAFPYSSSLLSCKRCRTGRYTLTPQAWVSTDSSTHHCRHSASGALLCPNVSYPEAQCKECPVGAECTGGARVNAQLGHWGTTTLWDKHRLVSRFPVLSFDYACTDYSCRKTYDSCSGKRGGFACGQCKAGYGEAFGNAKCVSDADCDSWMSVLAWLLLPFVFTAIATIFTRMSGLARDGTRAALATILFVLFQTESIVRTNEPEMLSPFARLALFEPFVPVGSICLWSGMSARAKAFAPVLFNIVTLVTVYLLYCAHAGAYWFGARWLAAGQPSRARYGRALVAVFLAGYGSIAASSIRFVAPLVVEDYRAPHDSSWYQSLTGEPWMQTWDQWLAATWLLISVLPAPLWVVYGMSHLRAGTMRAETFGLGVVFPLPIWLATLGWRRPPSRTDTKHAWEMFSVLASSYTRTYWYWSAVTLLQRQLFGLAYLSLNWSPVSRGYAMGLLTALFTYVHVHTRPYCSRAVNHVGSLALMSLFAVCMSSTLSSYRHEHGVLASGNLTALQGVTMTCLTGVVLAACFVLVRSGRRVRGPSRDQEFTGLDLPLLSSQSRGDTRP